ncbi:uncharacterized protein LOC127661656 isoform X1 [Xyrauchen texanus]|uniref:uncharacterized protein LOC127661656 isoform X1 n=1 Tax=Xyrauchen texanus TaxID=154827 RepID=UPI002241C05B|nr:uncharacterized protein LOC127661656 isoform X1 [Xyrauchen texanus]
MYSLILPCFFSVFLDGVFAIETDVMKTVIEGDSVTLNIDYSEIQYILIQWFAPQRFFIARIDGDDNKVSYGDDKIFRDRVQLDQTGSLTIRNIRIKHAGQYKVEIISSKTTTYLTFTITVHDSPRVSRGQTEDLKTVPVTAGDSTTLSTDFKSHGDELILWRFGPEGHLIAKWDIEDRNISYDGMGGRFNGRLQLDQTGSLTITNTRTTDTGLYQLQIYNNRGTKHRRFSVSVSEAGLSSGAVAGICVVVLLVTAAAATAIVIYYRHRISQLKTQISDTDELKTTLMMKGEPVTLSADDAHIRKDDVNVYFGVALLAKIRRGEISSDGVDERFRDRLQLDQKGFLIITDSRSTDTGLYELKIISSSSREIAYMRLFATVSDEEVIRKQVTKGCPVSLITFTEIKEDAEIMWRFENTTIANKNKTDKSISFKDDVLNGRFKGRLQVNQQTGSFIITDSRITDSGEYDLLITSRRAIVHQRFDVTVHAGVDTDAMTVLVMDGESVTLITDDTRVQSDDVNVYFEDTLIAQIREGKISSDDGRYIDKLQLDRTAGSLVITDARTRNNGLYKLKISEITYKRIIVTVIGEQVITKKEMEGHFVNLNTDTEIQEDAQIVWTFEDIVIADKNKENKKMSLHEDARDGRFRGRLKVNEQTGSLTITNTRITDSGEYDLKINTRRANIHKRFNVIICGRSRSGSVNESSMMNMLPLNVFGYDGANESDPLFNDGVDDGENELLGTPV